MVADRCKVCCLKYTKCLLKYTKCLLKYTKGLLKYTKCLPKYIKCLLKCTKCLLKYTKCLLKCTKPFHLRPQTCDIFSITLLCSNLTLIASTKSRSVRRASHQPPFMSSCLTISHTCLPCLPSES